MGNSRWRLQTTLNYVAQMVHELDREKDVEVLVADWGSDIPLREVLELTPTAARIVSFILIPQEIARNLQKDSPFPEVLALNAAARRAGGEYIGRIDQDMLVGRRFLKYFFELHEGRQLLDVPLASALLFANQRMVPFRFCVRCPSLWAVDKYIYWFGRSLKIEITSSLPFYIHGVGIWLAHRTLWDECGGYDERMIYMNGMEVNMIARLMMKYALVNLGQLVNYDFYHLEHYHPLVPRRSSTYRKTNPIPYYAEPGILNPNGPDWGLAQSPFGKLRAPNKTSLSAASSPPRKVPRSGTASGAVLPAPALQAQVLGVFSNINQNGTKTASFRWPPFEWLSFLLLIVSSGLQFALDEFINTFRTGYVVWSRRVHLAREAVHGQPLVSWPRYIVNIWVQKKTQRKTAK
jgi:hypothetical protein